MNPVSRTSPVIDFSLAQLLCIGVSAFLTCSETAYPQLLFFGFPGENKKFDILVNEYGYSDSMLDQRWPKPNMKTRSSCSIANIKTIESRHRGCSLGRIDMIDFESLGHINIVVPDLDKASAFYESAFGAVSLQEFPHFRNVGFARSAGFLEAPEAVDVSIRFLRLPTPEGVILELMEYHHPAGVICCPDKVVNGLNCVGHIALRVKDIDAAFAHVSAVDGVRLIHPSADYRPFKIDSIKPDEFRFFDPSMEANAAEKEAVCRTVGSIRYFYFLDPYGVQWEFEQGHTDIGSE